MSNQIVTPYTGDEAVSLDNFNRRIEEINAGAAPAEHEHTAEDVTSGVLPVARGGTGQTSLQAARNAMGLGNTTGALPVANGGTGASDAAGARANLGITPGGIGAAAASHQHGAGDIASGTLPVERGGTGQASLSAARNAMGLGNTTGALPVANGGTGASDAAGARANLGITPGGIGAAAASHSQAASTITAGTLPAGVVATVGADYTTSRLRNISAGTGDLTAGSSALGNGVIYLVYE